MRAKMSWATRRGEGYPACEEMQDEPCGVSSYLAFMAEREAKAILAETEPEGIFVQLQQRKDLRHQEFLGEAQDALVSALTRFCQSA